jgi:hypothetical protein
MKFCRLLHHSVGAAQSIVDVQRPVVTSFADAQSAETQDRIFDELNTLSVVYRAPASTFIDTEVSGGLVGQAGRQPGSSCIAS